MPESDENIQLILKDNVFFIQIYKLVLEVTVQVF